MYRNGACTHLHTCTASLDCISILVRALLPEKTWARGCYRIKRVCHGQNMMWAIPHASLAMPKVIIHGWYTPSPFMVGLSLGLTH